MKDRLAELERCRLWRTVTLECYRAAVADSAQYAAVLNDAAAERHRKLLAALADEAENAPQADALLEHRITLSALLGDYFETAARRADELQEWRNRAERALLEITASLEQADDDHDGRIRAALERLRTLSQTLEGKSLRDALRTATEAIERSMDQIREERQLAITRFQKDMGGLLERPNPTGAAPEAGSSTVLFDRAEMQERISSIRSGEFFLLLLRARGVQLARVQLGDDVAAQLIAAFVARLRNMLPMDAEIGQWGEEEFIALVPRATAALSSSINKRVMENLPGPYGCVLGGKAVRPALEINVCGVSSVFQEDQEHIEDRLEGFFSRI